MKSNRVLTCILLASVILISSCAGKMKNETAFVEVDALDIHEVATLDEVLDCDVEPIFVELENSLNERGLTSLNQSIGVVSSRIDTLLGCGHPTAALSFALRVKACLEKHKARLDTINSDGVDSLNALIETLQTKK